MDKLYLANVRIRVSGKIIMPGDSVSELPENDMSFLLKKGYIKPALESLESGEPKTEDDPFKIEKDIKSVFSEDNNIDPDDANDDMPEFYTEEQLNNLKSKTDIIDYAESIGLTGLEASLHRPELIDKVLAYIEEVQQNGNI